MEIIKKNLKKKGWKEREIQHAEQILKTAELKKPMRLRFFDSFIFWAALFLTIIGNFIVSVVIVPILLVLHGFYLYLILFILGSTFGLLINSIVIEIEKMQNRDVIIQGILILALAMINVYIMAVFSNKIETILDLATPMHSPVAISAVYVAAFALPYLMSSFKKSFLTQV